MERWPEIEEWFAGGTKVSFKKGEIILRPEDKPDDVYLILDGYVKAYSLTRMGDENIRVFKLAACCVHGDNNPRVLDQPFGHGTCRSRSSAAA